MNMTWRATYVPTGISCPVTLDDVLARCAIEGEDAVWVDERTAMAGDWMLTEEAE